MGKRVLGFTVLAAVAAVFVGCDGSGGASGKVKVSEASDGKVLTSYMLGRDIGKTVKDLDADLDLRVLFSAMREVLEEVPSQLTDSAITAIDMQFRQDLQTRREEKRKKVAEDNKAAGEAFLAKNKGEQGVVTTESGLQYIVIKEGEGESPTLADKVTVHYHGTLLDGTVFDSSVDRNSPATFPLTGVIRGWTEALQLMKVGGKYKIFVPSDLAYGERGMPRSPIGANMALIFEIELLSIEQPAPPPVAEKSGGAAKK
jgi:FKBP-type peptidyl-prolyl cis-trans isomerase